MYETRVTTRSTGAPRDGPLTRTLPGFASIGYTDASDVSHYNGLAFGLRMARRDLNLGFAYTLGKAIDRSSSATPPQRPDAYGPPDQEEGLSDFDVRHKLALSDRQST